MSEQPPVERSLTDAYGELAVWQVERILGLGDRNPNSDLYGCFDRPYWHYRQIDAANARAQETAHFLSMLYLLEEEYNPFAGQEKIRHWAEAAIEFWTLIQERNGSFNEFYPHENSFSATAFSSWGIVEAIQLLDSEPPHEELRRACHWLSHHDRPLASHKRAAAILVLDTVGRMLDERRFVDSGRKKLVNLLQSQSSKGVFPESMGFDLGLQTITLYLLTLYVRRTRDEMGYEAIMNGMLPVRQALHPDGTFSAKTMTRRTQYFYPLAFVLLGEQDVVDRHLAAIGARKAINPAWLDDRHCVHLAINYLQSAYEVFRVCT